MIIGFGFGSPLTAFLMLIITALISYTIYGLIKNYSARKHTEMESSEFDIEQYKERRRAYYYEQRDRAYKMMEEYDLTDEEIEERIEQELKYR